MSGTAERQRTTPGVRLDGSSPTLDLLWLETLGRVAARAAHEVKGALNGVSVNLEVVRSRAERPEAPASAVQRFAESAAQQLESLIRMNESLLVLARPVRQPVDVGLTLVRLAALLGPSTAAEGGRLEVVDGAGAPARGEATTAAYGNAARLALASALLVALERKAQTTCRVGGGDVVVVEVTCSAGGAITVAPAITEALAAAGVRVDATAQGCSLAFPRAGASAESERRNDT